MDTIIEKVMLLQNVEFFTNIPTEQLSFLANIAEAKTYEKGEILFRENEPSDALFIIGSGRVSLFHKNEFINEITDNEAVGALGFFDQKPRLFTATCTQLSSILVIDSMAFFDLLEDRVHITRYLLQYFVKALRNAYTKGGIPSKHT